MEDINALYDSIKTAALDKFSGVADAVSSAASTAETAYSSVTSSAGKAYLRQFVDKSEWGSEMLNDDEFSELKTMVVDRVGSGGNNLSYKDYDKEAGGGIGYTAGIKDLKNPRTSLKFTLGKANIVKDGDTLYVADTYDFSGKASKLRDAPLFEKVDYLLDSYNSGRVSNYGMAHLAAELFGSKEGDGIPVRIKVGSIAELGLSEDDVSQLEDMQSYNSRVKDNRSNGSVNEAPTETKSADTVIDTSKAFKRFGVIGGDATLAALKKASGNSNITWDSEFIGSDGKTYQRGDRIPRGIKLRVVS